jgi:hypothetical protein
MNFTTSRMPLIICIVIAVAVVVIAIVVSFTSKPAEDTLGVPPGDESTIVPEEDADTNTAALETQGQSTETEAIEQDLNATDLSGVDSETGLIDQELQREGY